MRLQCFHLVGNISAIVFIGRAVLWLVDKFAVSVHTIWTMKTVRDSCMDFVFRVLSGLSLVLNKVFCDWQTQTLNPSELEGERPV